MRFRPSAASNILPSLWLYYSLRFPYVDPIIMVALIISPERAVTSQIHSQRNTNAKIGNPGEGLQTRMMNPPHTSSVADTKIQSVVLT
jgi:hypothetical protein